MPYKYFEHISDIGMEASAPTLEETFIDGVEGMLSVMFDLETIGEEVSVEISAEAPEVDLLFVETLNEVLSVQGRDDLALKKLTGVEITRTGGLFTLTGTARGEGMDLERHGVKTEVKGATYSGLFYNNGEGGMHVLKCVLDV
jgi:SHS2 domain-containing protein